VRCIMRAATPPGKQNWGHFWPLFYPYSPTPSRSLRLRRQRSRRARSRYRATGGRLCSHVPSTIHQSNRRGRGKRQDIPLFPPPPDMVLRTSTPHFSIGHPLTECCNRNSRLCKDNRSPVTIVRAQPCRRRSEGHTEPPDILLREEPALCACRLWLDRTLSRLPESPTSR